VFSGIIEQVGTIVSIRPKGNGRTVVVRSSLPVAPPGQAGVGSADRERVGLGDSIAINGACLTVDALHPPDVFEVTVGKESLQRTTLGKLKSGATVHLERALRLGDRLDGHLVQGHVDGLGVVSRARRDLESCVLWVDAPEELQRYIAVKGSICIDGVSLTVNEIAARAFRVNIVPYTADETLLGSLRVGSSVNLEVDVLSRYLERLMGAGESNLSRARLAALGYSVYGRGEQ